MELLNASAINSVLSKLSKYGSWSFGNVLKDSQFRVVSGSPIQYLVFGNRRVGEYIVPANMICWLRFTVLDDYIDKAVRGEHPIPISHKACRMVVRSRMANLDSLFETDGIFFALISERYRFCKPA